MTPAALAALHGKCFTTPRPWSTTEFTSLLSMRGVFLTTQQTGFALGRIIADEAELLTLVVDPAAQRNGYGAALLASYEATAKTNGAVEAFLEVSAQNGPATSLYHAAGYTESGRRLNYYSPPTGPKIDAILMRKALI